MQCSAWVCRLWSCGSVSYSQPQPTHPGRTLHAVGHGLILLMMGIMIPKTCWDRSLMINIELVASCWFSLFTLHSRCTVTRTLNLKLLMLLKHWKWCSRNVESLTQLKPRVTAGGIITATSLEIRKVIMLSVWQIFSRLSIPSRKQQCLVSSEGFSGGTESSGIMKIFQVSNKLWCTTHKVSWQWRR